MSEPRLRSAVRAVVLDPDDRILLVRFTFPQRSMWACPGGGIEPGESELEAIHRELAEEAGLTGATIGPCIWVREHVIPLFGGQWDGQRERYFLVRTASFEPAPHFSEAALASEYVTAIRWWTPQQLQASREAFVPQRLPELVAELVRGEVPSTPIDVGV